MVIRIQGYTAAFVSKEPWLPAIRGIDYRLTKDGYFECYPIGFPKKVYKILFR